MQKLSIRLAKKQQRQLDELTRKGHHPARVIRRARILLQSHDGYTDREIAEQTGASHRAVVDVRTRFARHGLDRALHDAPRSGKPPTFTGKHEAQIVALACTEAPEGCARWTMQLLAEQAVKDGVVTAISPQTVWLMLERQDTKPWRKKNGSSGIRVGKNLNFSATVRSKVQEKTWYGPSHGSPPPYARSLRHVSLPRIHHAQERSWDLR